jgi:hypothetical protein
MYRRFKLIEPAVAIASLVVGSTALSSVAWCGKEPPPSTSDLFSARSRSRTDVESTRWLKLQTISYRDQVIYSARTPRVRAFLMIYPIICQYQDTLAAFELG